MKAEPDRLEFVNGLRGLMALFVMLHHAWLIVWPIGYHQYPDAGFAESLTTWLSYGHFAVTAFIVISGFCLGLPIARRGAAGWVGARAFYWKRARRILPPYYGSVALTLLMIYTVIGVKTGTHWDYSIPVDWSKAWASLFMLQDVIGGAQINSVYWSIAVECQIYLIFPVIVAIWLRFGAWWAALVSCSLGYGVAIAIVGTPYQGLTFQFLAMFAFGFAAAFITHSPGRRVVSGMPWALTALALIVATGLYLRPITLRDASPNFVWLDLPIGLATACILVAGCLRNGPTLRILTDRRLLSVGAFSYSLYLMHMPFLQLVWQYAIWPLRIPEYAEFTMLVPLGGGVAIFCSWLFYRLVERHFDPQAAKRLNRSAGSLSVSAPPAASEPA